MASSVPKDEEAGLSNPGGPEMQSDDQPPPYQANYGTSDNVPPRPVGNTSDPPPSYDSLYGELKAAKTESTGFLDFVKKFVIIVLSTIGCTILIAIFLAIPISMIVIGSVYLDDCPLQKYIPIYLIVAGCFGVLKNVSSIAQRLKNRKEENDQENAKTNPFDGIVSCFLFVWFICGNVWIYGAYSDFDADNSKEDDDYCHPTLYLFAFWIMTTTYIIMLVSCTCCVCVGALVGLCGNRQDSN